MGDFEEASIGAWPDNIPAINVFIAMDTQWRPHRTGLDYAALPAVLDVQDVPKAERGDVFECLRVMESEALRLFSKD